MRALFISTRLAGTDGVSLESEKMARVLARLGFECFDCAGEGNAAARVIPELHFRDPVALALGERAFSGTEPDAELEEAIDERAAFLEERLLAIIHDINPDLLVLQNVWAIPMQLPLASALAAVVVRSGLPCLSHEHDYYWERSRFRNSRIHGFLKHYFPFHSGNVRHLCINSLAQRDLQARRGLHAALVPNVFDFAVPAPGIDPYNADFRDAAGLDEGQRLILQPTRVIPRKGIELAIELLAELADPRNVLVITHRAGDEGFDYLHRLQRLAGERRVDLRYLASLIGERDDGRGGDKHYTLWDSYPHADFVTYPSLYEGFGNALLETIYFRKPALVNRYAVYRNDIAPQGFRFIEIEGRIAPRTAERVQELLGDTEAQREMTEHNYRLASRHYSLEALESYLRPELQALGLA